MMRNLVKYFLISIVVFGASTALAQTTPPTLVDPADVTFFEHLKSQEMSELSIEELRQLTLLTFIESAETGEVTTKRLVKYGELLDTFVKQSNNDPEIAAIRKGYNGIRAREALIGMLALIFSKAATRGLDKLVRDNPDNGGVLMQRGLNAVFTPTFMGRNRFIERDFKALLSDRFALSGEARAYVLYYLALGYKKMGNDEAVQAQIDEIIQIGVMPWVGLAKEIN